MHGFPGIVDPGFVAVGEGICPFKRVMCVTVRVVAINARHLPGTQRLIERFCALEHVLQVCD